jgi:hypothetical protein
MGVAIGVNTELAVPALTAQLAPRLSQARHEPPATSDAAYSIGVDRVDTEAPEKFSCLLQLICVLRQLDDSR